MAVGSALMGTYFGILEIAVDWQTRHGPAANDGADRRDFASLGGVASDSPLDLAALREGFSTKGGLNEQVFRVFTEQNGAAALTTALDQVAARVRG